MEVDITKLASDPYYGRRGAIGFRENRMEINNVGGSEVRVQIAGPEIPGLGFGFSVDPGRGAHSS